MNDLSDCRCVYCNGESFALPSSPGPESAAQGAMRCQKCGYEYDNLWGIPFFGGFEESDLIGMLEIAAAGEKDFAQVSGDVRSYYEWVSEYHFSADRGAFFREKPFLDNGDFLTRHNDWLSFKTLTAHLDLRGIKALDVGAGLGFDSMRLAGAGAKVTSLEYNPILLKIGAKALPEANWFGGFSHLIPFKSHSFDMVFCNAALHHMRDIPQAMREMIRVARPGGWVVTSCDSYSHGRFTEAMELAQFNSHPYALAGVNERLPRLREYIKAILELRDNLDPSIYIFITPGGGGGFPGFKNPEDYYIRRWNLDADLETLDWTSGVFNMRARVLGSGAMAAPTQAHKDVVLSAGEFAVSLGSEAQAVALISSRMSEDKIDIPFPGENGRFFLQNGWRLHEKGSLHRQGYRRVRWFFNRSGSLQRLNLEIMAPYKAWEINAEISIRVNGGEIMRSPIIRGVWTRFSVPIGDRAGEGAPFCAEAAVFPHGDGFNEGVFKVRRFEIGEPESPRAPDMGDMEEPSLEAYLKLMYPKKREMTVLFWPCSELPVRVINVLRANSILVRAVVAGGQEDFFSWQPGVEIAGAFKDPNLWGYGKNFGSVAGPIDLIVAPGIEYAIAALRFISGPRPGFCAAPDGRLMDIIPPGRLAQAWRDFRQASRDALRWIKRSVRRVERVF